MPRTASENSNARELLLAQVRRFPAKDGHGDAVASIQVSFHLNLQIVEGIEAQVIVESFLIAAVTALDFAVMPRRSRTDRLVRNAVFLAEQIQRMHTLRFCGVGKFAAVVCLQRLRRIAETGERAFHKIHRRIAALLFIRIDKPLPAGFLDHGVLEKHVSIRTDAADLRHILYAFHFSIQPDRVQFCRHLVLQIPLLLC